MPGTFFPLIRAIGAWTRAGASLQTESGSPSGSVQARAINTNHTRAWYCGIAVLLLTTQIVVLHLYGQPFTSATGRILLWVNDPFSPETSQQLADWYSFSHIIHGFIFFGLLHLVAPRLPVAARL